MSAHSGSSLQLTLHSPNFDMIPERISSDLQVFPASAQLTSASTCLYTSVLDRSHPTLTAVQGIETQLRLVPNRRGDRGISSDV